MKARMTEIFNAIKEDQILLLAVIAFSILTICFLLIEPALTIGVLTGTFLTQYVTHKVKNIQKKQKKG